MIIDEYLLVQKQKHILFYYKNMFGELCKMYRQKKNK